MWVDSQRDGRPAECTWRSLLNTIDQIAKITKPRRETVEICCSAPNSPSDLSHYWAEVRHIVKTNGGDIAV